MFGDVQMELCRIPCENMFNCALSLRTSPLNTGLINVSLMLPLLGMLVVSDFLTCDNDTIQPSSAGKSAHQFLSRRKNLRYVR